MLSCIIRIVNKLFSKSRITQYFHSDSLLSKSLDLKKNQHNYLPDDGFI